MPVVATRAVAGVAEAEAAALEIGFPVVLKILCPDISHKSDVGGVALDLQTAAEVTQAARACCVASAQLRPDATVGGLHRAGDGRSGRTRTSSSSVPPPTRSSAP